MTTESISLIISISAMISTIFSPILVQIITTRAQMQKEKREYSERHKQEVIENYLKEMGKHIYSGCKKGNSDSILYYSKG